MVKKVFNSFIFASRGLKTTWREEHNFRIEVFTLLPVIFFIFYFDFSFIESAFCVIAMTIVLITEVINTAIEDICNKIEPHHDEVIGKIKDTAGAFVFISVLGAILIGCLVFFSHFNWHFF